MIEKKNDKNDKNIHTYKRTEFRWMGGEFLSGEVFWGNYNQREMVYPGHSLP